MERLFPFRLILDAEGCIQSSGIGIAKLFPAVRVGDGLDEVFQMIEPRHVGWVPETLAERRQLIILESRENGAKLKGELLALDTGDYLFVGGPWAESLKVLADLGLEFSDLPVHQGTADLLFLLSSRDIMVQDTRKLSDTLERSNERLQSILSNLPGIATRWHLAGDQPAIKFIGRQIEQLCGYPAADFMREGRRYESVIHPEDLALFKETTRMAIDSDEQFTMEYRVCHADGSVKWVVERGHAIMEGERKMLDSFIFDITTAPPSTAWSAWPPCSKIPRSTAASATAWWTP